MTTTPAFPGADDWSVSLAFACNDTSWRVLRLAVDERLSTPISGTIRLVGGRSDDPTLLLGQAATIAMRQAEYERTISGVITRVEPLGRVSGLPHARVVFESRVGLARRTRRFRIFQDVTPHELAVRVFGTIPGVSFDNRLRRGYARREYCVQHGEDDLTFLSRVLEDEGITWFVQASDGGEVVVLVDAVEAFRGMEPNPSVECVDGPLGSRAPGVTGVMFSLRLPSPAVVQRDWDWPTDPAQVRERHAPASAAASPLGIAAALGEFESFPSSRSGAAAAGLRVSDEYELLASRDRLARCDSDLLGVAPGRWLDLEFDEEGPRRLLVVGVRHVGSLPQADLLASSPDEPCDPAYVNGFECVPTDVEYRPERVSDRPRIHGLQTAVVVGPPDEEIHTDEHGRIRVRMHWDRSTTPDADASCWLRVAQSWAGQGWGAMFVPRVGMEVLVAFLDGDPDRPICVGCVYNGAHRPPYDLPADRTKSTIRTQSTPGGAGHNELTFDDAAGSEQVYVRAQRDLEAHVLNDLKTKVDASESRRVGGQRHTEVGADDVLHIRKDEIHHVDGAQEVHVGGSVALQIDGGAALGDAAASAPGMTVAIIQGGYRLSAPQRIELVCGPSTIVMTPAGITMTGPSSVNVVCGGASVALAPGALSLLAPLLSIAAPGASLGLGAAASLSSAGGVKLGCGDDCELNLSGGATLRASRVMIEAGSEFVAEATRAQVTGFDEAVLASDVHVRLEDTTARVVLEDGLLQVPD